MASAPIYNPPIPYLGIVDRGFQPGRMVKIQGTVPPSANRFAINLLCGPNMSAGDDIALHFNPRFTDNRIIRNSLLNRAWQQEEFHGNSMPLVRGQGFEIIMLCDPHHFKIAINGHHFVEFVHRVPYQRVTHISIDGDVIVSLVVVEGGAPGGFGGAPAPMAPGMPGNVYPNLPQPGMPGAQHYPTQPGYGTPMPGQPGYGQAAAYPPGQYGTTHHGATHHGATHHGTVPMATAMGVGYGAATVAGYGHHSSKDAMKAQKKAAKKQAKMNKKAYKHGIPVAGMAGMGAGAYAVHKHGHHKHHGHHGHSSSSSSSSSEEE